MGEIRRYFVAWSANRDSCLEPWYGQSYEAWDADGDRVHCAQEITAPRNTSGPYPPDCWRDIMVCAVDAEHEHDAIRRFKVWQASGAPETEHLFRVGEVKS